DEQIGDQHVLGRVANPRQVLELVGQVEAVCPSPHAVMRRRRRDVDADHPERDGPEREQERELEAVESPYAPGGRKYPGSPPGTAERRGGVRWRCNGYLRSPTTRWLQPTP